MVWHMERQGTKGKLRPTVQQETEALGPIALQEPKPAIMSELES